MKMTPLPKIDCGRCTGCGRCVAACSERVLTLKVSGFRKHAAAFGLRRCTGCLRCIPACPVEAMTVETAEATEENSS